MRAKLTGCRRFFFSSRRRHTRFDCDWSSDVCSSDLENVDNVTPGVLYATGTIAKISQIQRGLGGVQLLLHGETRATALHYSENGRYLEAVVREVEDLPPLIPGDAAFVGLHREARERAAELGQESGLPEDVVG